MRRRRAVEEVEVGLNEELVRRVRASIEAGSASDGDVGSWRDKLKERASVAGWLVDKPDEDQVTKCHKERIR
jgi:hypothetical protein